MSKEEKRKKKDQNSRSQSYTVQVVFPEAEPKMQNTSTDLEKA